MELELCCDRTPTLKHKTDFSEYYFRCSGKCGKETNYSTTPSDAADRWNSFFNEDEDEVEGGEVSGIATKYRISTYIKWAINRAKNEELIDCDVEFDDYPETKKYELNGGVYVKTWILVTDGDIESAEK